MSEFIQPGAVLQNQFKSDTALVNLIQKIIPSKHLPEVTEELTKLGERVITDVLAMAKSAEAHPPELVNFDSWGNRIDEVIVNRGWTDLHKVSAEEKIVSTGYARKYGAHSRIVQFAKLYLFHPSSAFYSCPLAMTDGAAKLIETYAPKQLSGAFDHLTSSEPSKFWTSGQWMTERSGGSDVSHTETIARKINGDWRLFGTKWFTSAITSEMSMALARIEDEKGNVVEGSKGLSLFYIEIRNGDGKLNNIEVLRLKDKLGTKALPTAELKLNGTRAELVGNIGDGVKQISSMFNVTRLYNSVTSVAAFRRILALASDYSSKRMAFGKLIAEHTLNAQVLKEASAQFNGCFHFTFLIAEIFGQEEVFTDQNNLSLDKEELNKILRMLTPVLKLYTAKKTVLWTSELLEVFGGVGYIEDSGIPVMYRDNQVFSIWEGTTNVLSLDLLRALKKDQSWSVLVKFLKQEMAKMKDSHLKVTIEKALENLNQDIIGVSQKGDAAMEAEARHLAFKIGDLMSAFSWLRSNSDDTELLEYFTVKNFR